MIRVLSFLPLLLPASGAFAHPHIFVDTALEVALNEAQQVTGVTVSWAYDEFFTLLLFEDMGLDPDGDGVLSDAEMEELQGFELANWPLDYAGDLYLFAGDEAVELGRPEARGVTLTDGRIQSDHYRPLLAPSPADGLRIAQYDPTYYIAYTLSRGVTVQGACEAIVTDPDLDETARAMQQELANIPEDGFTELLAGHLYAQDVRIVCAASE
ncbi:DUF1007 family protein [Salipiger sp. 1_MG-2023]|uniref:DUF1007 family protein n=1 Tax=Salipiger sp. 1_MG-2023 TaxID=3062665 RepID=UPI0026E2D3A7|nr:DUF1007 family protein [Salipiger sp. 1_MG-2023]MDO6586519.1 DUF1007 family protein [Salipiger sp. 1_MG-2023]